MTGNNNGTINGATWGSDYLKFDGIDDCVKLSDLEVANDKNIYVKSIENVFNDKESIVLNNRKTELFFNGVMLTFEKEDGLYKVYNSGEFLGLGVIKNKLLKRDVIVR